MVMFFLVLCLISPFLCISMCVYTLKVSKRFELLLKDLSFKESSIQSNDCKDNDNSDKIVLEDI